MANHSGENHDASKAAYNYKGIKSTKKIHVFDAKDWEEHKKHQQAILGVQELDSVERCKKFDNP
jgi:hypothetical protein